MLPILPRMFFDLIRLVLWWGVKESGIRCQFFFKKIGSIGFINLGFTMLSILPKVFLILFDVYFG